MSSPRLKFEAIHQAIQFDRIADARALIQRLCKRAPRSRDDRLQLAYFARRTFLYDRTLELLAPVVYPRPGRARSEATDEERAEYATALAELGASEESIQLFSEVNLAQVPWAMEGWVNAHYRQWDWKRPFPALVRALKDPHLPFKDRLTLEFYYGIALLHGHRKVEAARATLERVLAEADQRGFPLLATQVQLMLMQCFWFSENWEELRKTGAAVVERDEQGLGIESCANRARFWLAMVDLRLSADPGARKDSLKRVRELRAQYAASGQWWHYRNCSYYEALHAGDEDTLLRYYFGNPNPQTRERLLKFLGRDESSLPTSYELQLGSLSSPPVTGPEPTIDLALGGPFKPGRTPLNVLRAVTADLFEPPRLGTLHERLYPGERFNPASSPQRVHQALWQTRKALQEHQVPLEIVETNERYELRALAPCRLKLHRESRLSPEHSKLLSIQTRLQDRAVSSRELAELLQTSLRTAIRLARSSTEQGLLQEVGRGRQLRYRLAINLA